ncbi:ribonucleoside-diphosphate reductase subunit alpha [Thomasclavelia cocleata]|uniref:Ribonucleoside-diphosphate reductase n=1 Tax=Thomasclavelia cocleata TaxID=69824 RepID=A0A1I0CYV3_9FIRM|nr:ribonucleoside-diphosphate reductase subunit alpha [Thomasclavelia cocleata]MCR1959773.1 ribonucleoside-diphosphate reductase subunit alpha [Thomasclavelia cocleata]NDO41039.1 ribonucleoside-diphosphate reductase subunit alpha [Thomasclavelia cocleata]PJN81568.1 ribonucleoside-diphosphate reductase subunit alpha [Thomasclavelia cocleata]SET24525.1 ribonucleoside-diphosphate reductase alpha chain [Thomasclavelia cocleata]
MIIQKRNGQYQDYDNNKIKKALEKAFKSLDHSIKENDLELIIKDIEQSIYNQINVEMIQDYVEESLMKHGYLQVAKAYILYRQKHSERRRVMNELLDLLKDKNIEHILLAIQHDYPQEEYSLQLLLVKFKSFYKENMNFQDALTILAKASNELISKEAPKWEMISARFLSYEINRRVNQKMVEYNIENLYDKIHYLTNQGYYGKYILEYYSQVEIEELSDYLDDKRDELFTYSGLELVMKRYLIQDHQHEILEKPQEMFMLISMHLAMKENDKIRWAKEFYDILSTLKVTMATPTMSNARKPFHQMSSCFIDTVDDSLAGIYKSIDNFAKVSKNGGGMGLYFGKVRANGSSIRGFKGAAGGVIRWIKLVNDTATAVDQLGVRQGAAAVYLDAWHRDLPEFLQLKTNNGDDRMKAHDIFPAVCYPDLFWKLAKNDLDAPWYLMCPHEIHEIKGYYLEDYYGDIWQQKYYECVEDERITKRVMTVKEIIRLIIKSLVETGTPFTFNRDHVNKMNPNNHQGMIYCSNLCTEIAQNMKAMEILPHEVIEVAGEKIIIEKTVPGDFVVCNLASLTLGRFDVTDDKILKHTIEVVVRALDNVIDLNYYPIPFAKITNQKYRPIGLGTSGYHHMLVKQGISFESDEHLEFIDKLYEKINYFALTASCNLAKEKGSYDLFQGSDFETGTYFKKRNYQSEAWEILKEDIQKYGLRNGYLLAIAPTSSTSIIAGTSAAVDPIMKKYFMEEKKGSMIIRVAPDLDMKTFWLYKNAHHIDQSWIIKAAGIRQRHIDQAQSVNLYMTNEFTFRKLLDLYIQAWQCGVKTIYYVRSQSLEVEECESCSA